MASSGDSLLISLFSILLPAFILLVGTIMYSYNVITRYSKALSRLYRSSFRGIDSERKRIASELHDHLAIHSIKLSEGLGDLKNRLKGDELDILNKLESDFNLFKYKTHQAIEYMYPKVLIEMDWESSFKQLANELSIGNIRIDFETFAITSPKNEWLFHTYWAIKEIVTNAIRHGNVNNVQITVTDEERKFIIAIHYIATLETKKWLETKPRPGLGTQIIQDRLSIVGAKMNTEIIDGVVTQSIVLRNEDINLR